MKIRFRPTNTQLVLAAIAMLSGCATPDQPKQSQNEFDHLFDCGLDVATEQHPALVTLNRAVVTPHDANNINDSVEIGVAGVERTSDRLTVDVIGGPKCQSLWRAEATRQEPTIWSGQDSNGKMLAEGIYYVRPLTSAGSLEPSVPITISSDPCVDRAGLQAMSDTKVLASFQDTSIAIDTESAGRLCVVARSGAESDPDDRVRVKIDGVEVISPENAVQPGAELVASIPVRPGAHRLEALGAGGLSVDVGYVPASFDIPEGPPEPAIRCKGMLRGFAHPFGQHGRRPMVRQGVPVECFAWYKVDFGVLMPIPGIGYPTKPQRIIRNVFVRAVGETGPAGEFDLLIDAAQLADNSINQNNAELVHVMTKCIDVEDCGYEAMSVPRTVISNLPVERQVENLDINDVLHLTRPTMEQAVGQSVEAPVIGARLISNGKGLAMNDRPVVIHEQIDTANIEHTRFMTWALSGQPTLVPPDASPDVCAQISAKPDERPIPCIQFSGQCNPSRCGQDGVRCRTVNIMQEMLENGYDIWTVDHISGESDVLRIAASAPALYDAIRSYGATANQLVDAGFGSSEPLPVTPPGSAPGTRRIAVGGISLGAVIARTGLKLWEKRHSLVSLNVSDLDQRAITLPGIDTSLPTSVQFNDPLDDVALYFSFDGPHLGARAPTAVQAYIQDIPEKFDIEQQDELRADSTKGLLERWVSPAPGIGCISEKDNGELDAKESCTVSNRSLAVVENSTSAFSDRIFQQSIRNLDPSFGDPLGRPADGLPDWIPSIAIANGSDPVSPRNVGTDEVFEIHFDIDDAPDRRHHMKEKTIVGFSGRVLDNGVQPAGSEWDGLCRAEGVSIATIATVTGWEAIVSSLFGCTNSVTDALTCVPGAIFRPFTGDRLNVKVNANVKMKPRYDGSGNRLPATGFPTIVRTESALLDVTANREFDPAITWRDYFIADRDRFHSDIREDQCSFIMYHLDGTMSGDGDGYPACESVQRNIACTDGGRWPGERWGSGSEEPVCDCNDARADIYPGAPGILNCDLRPTQGDFRFDF